MVLHNSTSLTRCFCYAYSICAKQKVFVYLLSELQEQRSKNQAGSASRLRLHNERSSKMNKPTKWLGETKCNLCHEPALTELVDGKTTMGPWAVMCPGCFLAYGVGIGIGRGQHYRRNQQNELVKFAG